MFNEAAVREQSSGTADTKESIDLREQPAGTERTLIQEQPSRRRAPRAAVR
jgi:hypothetical protein